MPRIELIPEVLYNPNDPIHWEVDNLPLKNILRRENLINLALDNVIQEMRDAIGTSGSVANRLNQSINPDGSLKTAAVDETLHSIEEHTDTDDFVRMTKNQSDKLDEISDNATNLTLKIFTNDVTFVGIDDGELQIKPSETILPIFETPNILKFTIAFPTEAIHTHYYELEPVHANLITPDYTNYKTTSVSTPYLENSLRIYINGVRIFSNAEVYVPGASVNDPWTLMIFLGRNP